MKKVLSLFLCLFLSIPLCKAQKLTVSAQILEDKTNTYVGNATVELEIVSQGSLMTIYIAPFPNTKNGLLYFFGRKSAYSSTWQNLCVGADNYWIISTLLNNSERNRHYLGFYSGEEGYNLYFYQKAYEDAEPVYNKGYHLSFDKVDHRKVMTFIVSRIDLLRELPAQGY